MTLKLNDLPEISFINTNAEEVLNEMIKGYEKAYYESTGTRKKLYPGDPIRIWLYSQALREMQLRANIEHAAKQNLLKYSGGDYLENVGALSRTTRFGEQQAAVTMKFVLSEAKEEAVKIPAGTRVSPDNTIYFEVENEAFILAGEIEIYVEATCMEGGAVGNGFTPGQIDILVDPLPWVASVENTETSQGGADVESDESLRERIHLAPEGYSVAGPSGAYEYYSRSYSPLVEDIKVTSPSPVVVDICILLKDGVIPSQLFVDGLQEHLSAKKRRPLTDLVQVSVPEEVNYTIELTYYISSEDIDQEELITTRVNKAIDEYVAWQREKIGRDINPDELIFRLRRAGAKRIEITSPQFEVIEGNKLATVTTQAIEFGGFEDE